MAALKHVHKLGLQWQLTAFVHLPSVAALVLTLHPGRPPYTHAHVSSRRAIRGRGGMVTLTLN